LSENGVATKLVPWLIGFGIGSLTLGFVLLWTTQAGWVFVATGALELLLGLLAPTPAGRDPDRVRLVVSVGFLILAAFLIRDSAANMDKGRPGMTAVALIGAAAAVFVGALGIAKTYSDRRGDDD
jgi:hypothetical protein